MVTEDNNDNMENCSICYEECSPYVPVDANSKNCEHIFCEDCLKTHLKLKINEGKVSPQDMTCPHNVCERSLSENEISSLLNYTDHDFFEKYKRFKREYELQKDPLNTWCPLPSCNAVFKKDPDSTNAVCPDCNHKFCLKCFGPNHPFLTCQMAGQSAYVAWMKERKRLSEGVKRCPKCKFYIEKNGGCVHMTCQKCSYQFCWICKSKWTGSCSRQKWCKIVALNDAKFWGPNEPVRYTAKIAAGIAVVPVAATAGCLVLVVGAVAVSGALIFGGPIAIGVCIKKQIEEAGRLRRIREVEKRITRATKLMYGFRVLLIGFDGFLSNHVQPDTPGRWISGKNKQFLFYDQFDLGQGMSNLVYVEELSSLCEEVVHNTNDDSACCSVAYDLILVNNSKNAQTSLQVSDTMCWVPNAKHVFSTTNNSLHNGNMLPLILEEETKLEEEKCEYEEGVEETKEGNLEIKESKSPFTAKAISEKWFDSKSMLEEVKSYENQISCLAGPRIMSTEETNDLDEEKLSSHQSQNITTLLIASYYEQTHAVKPFDCQQLDCKLLGTLILECLDQDFSL